MTMKLNLGCGQDKKKGWTNIDINHNVLRIDLTKDGLSIFEDNTIDFIYSQHFIEHITWDEAITLMVDCQRVLTGYMRISTPDLAEGVRCYQEKDLTRFSGFSFETPAELMAQYYIGHSYLYDYEELERLLKIAGFNDIKRVQWRESDIPELQMLETRPDFTDLIVECRA